jgi:hypothetical protein
MRVRDEIQKRIEKKQQEIRELELQQAAANAYLQALQDSLRLLPKEAAPEKLGPEQTLRPGSAVAKSREAILKANKPLHVTEILKAIGRPVDKSNRVSLSGSLGGYAKRVEIFTRPAPNTFGLLELNHNEMPAIEEPPEGFGDLPAEETADENVEDVPGISDDDVPF